MTHENLANINHELRQSINALDREIRMASKYVLTNTDLKHLLAPVYIEKTKHGEYIVYRTDDMTLGKSYVVFWEGTHYIFKKDEDGVKMYEVGIKDG